MSSRLHLGLLKCLFPVGLPVKIKILKALLSSSILATWPAHLNLLDLITVTILSERYKYEAPHFGFYLYKGVLSYIIIILIIFKDLN